MRRHCQRPHRVKGMKDTESFIEYGYSSINKEGEELCGDKVECICDGKNATLVLADGMGSGVKANILATLTSKILCTMAANDVPMEECVKTMVGTLPVCKTREMAYSTFSVVHLNVSGKGYLFEFDNPRAVLAAKGATVDLMRVPMDMAGKRVWRTDLQLNQDDTLLLMSDGVVHAGIGKLLNFGWDRSAICTYLNESIKNGMSARCIAALLAAACNELYMDKAGDDATVAAVKLRKKLKVDIMVGPPADRQTDDFYISRFLSGGGKKAVCGGTSSHIVARHLGAKLATTFDLPDRDVPPIAFIEGIDLATEGVLTLRKLLRLSERYMSPTDLNAKYYMNADGASLLADLLFEQATDIHFHVGQAVNTAHQGLPIDTTMKIKLVEKLSSNLAVMGKNVETSYF